jgi:small subunit ribosomal protein S1
VQAQIINIDAERKRIGLSLKRLEADPWSAVGNRYKVGQLVEGMITKLAKFGAFARIRDDEEIVSELAEGHVAHPKEVVHEGQIVTLRIIRIDSQERRLGLSLKRVAKGEYADADWQQGLAEAMDEQPPEAPPDAPMDEPLPPDAFDSAENSDRPPAGETQPSNESEPAAGG